MTELVAVFAALSAGGMAGAWVTFVLHRERCSQCWSRLPAGRHRPETNAALLRR